MVAFFLISHCHHNEYVSVSTICDEYLCTVEDPLAVNQFSSGLLSGRVGTCVRFG